PNIEKHEFWLNCRRGLECLRPAKHGLNLMPAQPQQHRQALGCIDIVIHHQNPSSRPILASRYGWLRRWCWQFRIGQSNHKLASFSESLAMRADYPAVHFYQIFHESQTNAQATA